MKSGTGNRLRNGLVDRIAIGMSGLCLIHCITTALLVALATSVGGALLDPLIHEAGLAVAMALGALAFSQGYVSHGRLVPIVAGGLGFCAMGSALVLGHGDPAEIPLTMLGVSLVAVGHYLNRKATLNR